MNEVRDAVSYDIADPILREIHGEIENSVSEEVINDTYGSIRLTIYNEVEVQVWHTLFTEGRDNNGN